MLKNLLLASVAVVVGTGIALAAAEAIKIELKDFTLKAKHEGTSEELFGYNEGDSKIFMYVQAIATVDVKIPADGDYTLTLEASCDEAKGEKAKIMIKMGDTVVEKSFELKATEAKEYTFTVKAKKGTSKLSIEFLNDLYKDGEYDMNFYIHSVKIEAKK